MGKILSIPPDAPVIVLGLHHGLGLSHGALNAHVHSVGLDHAVRGLPGEHLAVDGRIVHAYEDIEGGTMTGSPIGLGKSQS